MIGITMDMPKSCMECIFCIDEQYKVLEYQFTEASVSLNYINRHPNCPLIEIDEKEGE